MSGTGFAFELADYAQRVDQSRGRRYPEPAHAYRTAFMRDRDRIIHATAFRRLSGKTQVFRALSHDHYRSRLTHTLEVSQIARTVARQLRLDEDLVEAIALAHDLGHPPFGHAGERGLAARMAGCGGFEHNRQGLRVVDRLERRYPGFDGLNLTYETRAGIALHSPERNHPDLAEFEPAGQMSLESQVVDEVDAITYTAHDIDDALGSGLITLNDLEPVTLWREATEAAAVRSRVTCLEGKTLARSAIQALIGRQVDDLLAESRQRLINRASPEAVRIAPDNTISLPAHTRDMRRELGEFLFVRVYRHPAIAAENAWAQQGLIDLFDYWLDHVRDLPESFIRRLDGEGPERVVCDYIAGMTDRFAEQQVVRFAGGPPAPTST